MVESSQGVWDAYKTIELEAEDTRWGSFLPKDGVASRGGCADCWDNR
jgi:hypothetical protein